MEKYKVLIVEDDPMVSMINAQYVEKNRQFSVASSCRNGQEALEYLCENKVDLVVLDVFMPYLDGIDTLKKIRASGYQTEVIMVTAANDTSTLEQTMNLGVIDYLIKPFAMERLNVALEKFLSKVTALSGTSVLDQSKVDSIISGKAEVHKTSDVRAYPKGIQEVTLKTVREYFNQKSGWQTVDMVQEETGLSIVTVRHYLSYLVSSGELRESINYSTGGRPSMLYKKLNKD